KSLLKFKIKFSSKKADQTYLKIKPLTKKYRDNIMDHDLGDDFRKNMTRLNEILSPTPKASDVFPELD
ncbi:MAG: hypothetical protein PF588_09210, partial [Candidatus Kapabacteria bacterium]|nr:hypothetical protein [Candidatus Kapabacteria bacterium]